MSLRRPVIAGAVSIALCCIAGNGAHAQRIAPDSVLDWRTDWAVADELALERDTEGYQLPTAIAFVPQPGPGPKDPLYFMTELRGKVKVVTNDRTVYTFAEGFLQSQPLQELPEFAGETGLAGICLAPKQGYVFVTFAALAPEDSLSAGRRPHLASRRATSVRAHGAALRNSIVRFQATPGIFSLRPSGQAEFHEVFAGYEAAISHQVGGCQVADDLLHVSVADGYQTEQSQDPNSPLGKILRMTLDGRPAPGNPYPRGPASASRQDFVWALGLRNPFGIKAVGERLFVADNGVRIDRFLQIRAGENYLWNGNDWSIGARADLTFYPDIGPAQLEYYPGGTVLPARFSRGFLLAASNPVRPGILHFGYRVERGTATAAPEYILQYRGRGPQIVTGVALGPDGVYFVPTLPDARGAAAVFRLSHRPQQPHPVRLGQLADPESLMEERGCFGCHQIGGAGGTMGPALDAASLKSRLRARLESAAYAESVRSLDSLKQEPFQNFKEARAEVLAAAGEDRLRTWVIYRLLEPRFDDPAAQMPNPRLSKSQATVLADHLLREEHPVGWADAIVQWIPRALRPWRLMYRHLLLAFVGGLAAGGSLIAVLPWFLRRLRWRRA